MIKYFCDKCGEEIDKFKIFTVTVEPPEVRSWDYAEIGTYSLCYECVKELNKCLERKAKKL